jgi:tyrosyl-tRNA synthetase
METGISYTEFSYMLLQSYDFVELRRRYGVTIQLGGSDQWGNITAGTELVRRMDGAQAHGLTFPLLTTSSGRSSARAPGNAVWLDAERTTPFAFTSSGSTPTTATWGGCCASTRSCRASSPGARPRDGERPHLREAQRALAAEVTTRVHGPEAARVAEEVGGLLFQKEDPRALSEAALAALAREVPYVEVARPRAGSPRSTPAELFTTAGTGEEQGRGAAAARAGRAAGERAAPHRRGARARRRRPARRRAPLLRKGARDHALVRVR